MRISGQHRSPAWLTLGMALLALPGLALASAKNSCMVLAGWSARTMKPFGKLPIMAMCTKSLIGSYGMLLRISGPGAIDELAAMTSV